MELRRLSLEFPFILSSEKQVIHFGTFMGVRLIDSSSLTVKTVSVGNRKEIMEDVEKWKPIDATPEPPPRTSRGGKMIVIYLVLLGIAFLAGFVPMWLKARANEKSLTAQSGELRDLRLQTLLANATIDARRGNYEPARQAASEFFNRIALPENAFSSEQQPVIDDIRKQSYELVTLLARSDPASAERLSNMYTTFRTAIKREIVSTAPAPSAPVALTNSSTVNDAATTNETTPSTNQ